MPIHLSSCEIRPTKGTTALGFSVRVEDIVVCLALQCWYIVVLCSSTSGSVHASNVLRCQTTVRRSSSWSTCSGTAYRPIVFLVTEQAVLARQPSTFSVRAAATASTDHRGRGQRPPRETTWVSKAIVDDAQRSWRQHSVNRCDRQIIVIAVALQCCTTESDSPS